MHNWSAYLDSIRQKYHQWWKIYTFTDVVGQRRVEPEASPLWNFDLQVETIKTRDEQQTEIERFSVLEGLRKYATDHVLLVGKPGSGKSTALLRLLLEEAETSLTESIKLDRIPVLVELRYYQISIIDLIRNFCLRHGLLFKNAEIEELLFQQKFFLLVDGLNELPSEEARRDLQAFRQNYGQIPMVFTTRYLGVGGDLGISKKLEMQPLTETQMQEFVCAYLPEQGEEMLKQLGRRLQEFGQTPLLLWMLCSVFKNNQNKVPSNLGSVFRLFTQSYDKEFKQDIPVSSEFRFWSSRLLQQLAWVMTQGNTKTDLNVAISRSKAENILIEYLWEEKIQDPKTNAFKFLNDLLKCHLIQLGANDQIEFRHQLIQEYYTAEYLLNVLLKLSDDCLKRDYLNYLKWTEPLALMAELIEDETQAVRMVKLGLEVDWQLGARLAGEVKSKWHEQTINLITDLKLPQLVKIRLLGISKSEQGIPGLIQLLQDPESLVRSSAANALGEIKSEQGILGLIQLLQDPDSYVRMSAANALGEIKSEQGIPGLIQLSQDPDSLVRMSAVNALVKIKSEQGIPGLIQLLQDPDSYVRMSAADALVKIKLEQGIPGLIQLLQDPDSVVCRSAAHALGEIKSEQIIIEIVKLLNINNFVNANNGNTLYNALVVIQTIQEYCKLYNPLLTNYFTKSTTTMSIRSQLIDFLLNSSIFTTIQERRSLLTYFGFDALLKKITLEAPPLQFTTNLVHTLEMEGQDTLLNFIDNLANSDFLGIDNKERLKNLSNDIRYIKPENWHNEFIGNQPQPQSEPIPIPKPNISTKLINILHLSDLHFSNSQQAGIWSNQLAEDLHNDLKISHLDALILSGDIANYSTPEEYQAAKEFFLNLRQDFPLQPEQIIIVPGNHDLNWKISEEDGYQPMRRKDLGSIDKTLIIDDGGIYIPVVNPEGYQQRFIHFSNFYQAIKNQSYSLEYSEQYTLDNLSSQNILILGLNSAWQLDHYYKSRASINMNALSNALAEIRRHPEYNDRIKIAVWHHPLDSVGDDRIQNQGFMEQLAVAGFRFFLHGHVHKAETSFYRYDMSKNGRKLDRICAGTFGVSAKN